MPLPTINALARQTISYAFSELEKTITPGDARNFRSIVIEQVKSDVLKLENELAERRSLRNMRRLAPLFQGLEHYAKAMDVLCNGTPFLSWIWAPISLILRIASEQLEAFDLIIKGYTQIADCLGRFAVLDMSFKGNPDFQQTLAVFYADILEYHKHAYKFVRRRSWKLLFSTSWHRFQRRFDNIFENLRLHEALIDKEANAYNIAEAQQMRREIRAWREESDQKFEQNEKEQSFRQFESIISWLKFDESDQLHTFHMLLEESTRYPGTCDWVLQNKKMASILQDTPDVPLLWIQGAAGTGKSVLASSIVNSAISDGSLVLSHFCNYAYPSSIRYEWILKSLLLQLVREDIDLAGHVFKNCVEAKKAANLPVLETLLIFLLSSISKEPRKTSYVRIVIDGIDECEPLVQNKVFNLISQATCRASNSDEVFCKAMIFCRFSSSASAKLRKVQLLSLAEEQQHVNASIRRYAAQRLQSIYSKFEQMSLTMNDIKDIEDAITEKADGMFLYARLVLEYLSSNIFFSSEEVKTSVYKLPAKLSEFYSKIITQILVRLDNRSVDRVKCALGWVAFSQRPLRKTEFLSAIAFSTGDTSVQHAAPQFMLDICAPLIEEKPDSTLGFIHVSVKEFLQSPSSNLVLVREDCLLQHGITTVTCLLAGTEAFASDLPLEPVLVRIIKGLHGFLIYSKEYWTDYLLLLIQPETVYGSTTSTLFDMAFALADRLSRLSINTAEDSQRLEHIYAITQGPSKLIDERIGCLPNPFLQTIINECLEARSENQLGIELQEMEARAQSIDDIMIPPIPSPRDGVSLILQKYQATIRYILEQSDYPGVTAAELESFQRNNRNYAYTCRVKGCIRASEGFERSAQCHEHEILHGMGSSDNDIGISDGLMDQHSRKAPFLNQHQFAPSLQQRNPSASLTQCTTSTICPEDIVSSFTDVDHLAQYSSLQAQETTNFDPHGMSEVVPPSRQMRTCESQETANFDSTEKSKVLPPSPLPKPQMEKRTVMQIRYEIRKDRDTIILEDDLTMTESFAFAKAVMDYLTQVTGIQHNSDELTQPRTLTLISNILIRSNDYFGRMLNERTLIKSDPRVLVLHLFMALWRSGHPG